MDILNFLNEFTSHDLIEKSSSRRQMLGTFGSLGKKAALAAIPFGLATGKAKAATQANEAISALQLALTLEYLEADFYVKALDSGVLPSGRPEAVYMQISKHETAHVNFLKAGLGDAAFDSPDFDFTAGGAFDPFNPNNDAAYAQLLVLAQAFEDTGVRAYKGQATNLMGTAFLQPALRIHSVEARHAAEVRRLRAAFLDDPLNEDLLPWITLNNRGPGMPPVTQPVYDGEQNVVQAGIDLTTITDFGAVSVSQSYDEPISGEVAIQIAILFFDSCAKCPSF
ncbi:ferritin-like domain-containing protein [Zunongwangia sp. F260]|uniref:Ferritin-like domain-containing protein n=1 Tax=Autumnicola lenta TaxID=3075593 RepID=A0ABU3CFR8_9FLAO|nr:ferritin-like domain-containing protein [Zunongwangia sp. F260]MDT0645200.1 ferritin-like domain-containing protein [Zunongwangia sp. F260]